MRVAVKVAVKTLSGAKNRLAVAAGFRLYMRFSMWLGSRDSNPNCLIQSSSSRMGLQGRSEALQRISGSRKSIDEAREGIGSALQSMGFRRHSRGQASCTVW